VQHRRSALAGDALAAGELAPAGASAAVPADTATPPAFGFGAVGTSITNSFGSTATARADPHTSKFLDLTGLSP
jgi:hypothetical protein